MELHNEEKAHSSHIHSKAEICLNDISLKLSIDNNLLYALLKETICSISIVKLHGKQLLTYFIFQLKALLVLINL